VPYDDAGGADILTFYDGLRYRLATAFTLAYPYGFTRIMSSYHWDGGPYRSVQWFYAQCFEFTSDQITWATAISLLNEAHAAW